MNAGILTTTLMLGLCTVLLSCASSNREDRIGSGEEAVMDQDKSNFLHNAAGKYRGPNLLWFQDPNKPEESVSDVEVGDNEINYNWQFRGKPQTGHMVFDVKADKVEVEWVDSWHAAEGFKCVGTHSEEEMKFLCHYGPKNEPQWGWRTELSMPNGDQFLVEMFNITPQGEEQIAVRILADRVK